MKPDASLPAAPAVVPGKATQVKLIGLGGAGLQAVELMARQGVAPAACCVAHTDARQLAQSPLTEKLLLGANITRGLKVGDPDVGRAIAEAEAHNLRQLCEGMDLVVIVAGLGGNTASGAAPVLARVARENGSLVLALVALPFEFEGRRRQQQAGLALKQLKTAADAVLCLSNQKVASLLDGNTHLPAALQIIDEMLSQGARGILRLLRPDGLIHADFADLCHVVRGRQAESCFATAEAMGEHRAREVVERLLSSPLLDNGRALAEADAVLVSLCGDARLSLREVNQVMEQLNRLCEHAQVIMGASLDPVLDDRLAVTVIAARRPAPEPEAPAGRSRGATAEEPPELPTSEFPPREGGLEAEGRGDTTTTNRAPQRYAAPPPELTPEQAERLLAGQGSGMSRRRKKVKLQQGMLPLDVVSKGRFSKSEPTIRRGEDLDTPTYIRRGMALN